MKNLLTILVVLLVTQSGFGQSNDSIIVNRVNDNYIEIQTLRHELFKWITLDNGVMKENFVPNPIPLKKGVVYIKDRLNRPVAFYVYADSIIKGEEHFIDGQLIIQSFNFSDSTGIDKEYWTNGNLRSLTYLESNQKKVYNYTEEGDLIELKVDYTELIRNADNYLFDKEYSKALDYYRKAEEIKPNEVYPKGRIAEIKDFLKSEN